jgi:hypothetical protein
MLHVNQEKYLTDYRVWLSFDNNVSGEIDLFPELWGEMFEPCLSGCYPFRAGTARMNPFAGIKFGVGWCRYISCYAKQRAECVKRIEATVESKRELIKVSL